MMHETAPRLALRRSLDQVAKAAAAASFLLVSMVSTASAYTVLGAYFDPGHAAAGATVTVGELPLAVDCETVDVWLGRDVTPSPPIESGDDARLFRLRGKTRHAPGGIGVGDQRPGTTYVFTVPAIKPGTYATYWQCLGGTGSFDAFDLGHTTFTVDPSVPGTDTFMASARPANGSSDTSRLVVGSLAGLVALIGTMVCGRPARPSPRA